MKQNLATAETLQTLPPVTRRPHALDPQDSYAASRTVRPRLSVVLLSHGEPRALEGALQVLQPRARAYGAQVIVVTEQRAVSVAGAFIPMGELEVVIAPAGSTLQEQREEAMRLVHGDIVTVRRDVEVGDGRWLDAFSRLVQQDIEVEVEIDRSSEVAILADVALPPQPSYSLDPDQAPTPGPA